MGQDDDGVVLDPAHCEEARAALARLTRLMERAENLEGSVRDELLAATRDMAHALEPVYESGPEQARSVAQFAEVAGHEATKASPDPGLLDVALQGLNRAALPVEEREPGLAEIVGRFAQMLANLGI